MCAQAWLVKGDSVRVVHCIQGLYRPSEQAILGFPQSRCNINLRFNNERLRHHSSLQ
jgi:hypothetical protein